MDYTEVIRLYSELDLNDKRNEFSVLLQKVDSLLIELLKKNGVTKEDNIKNYDINKDNSKNEDELLTFLYEDLNKIHDRLLLLMTMEMIDNKKE